MSILAAPWNVPPDRLLDQARSVPDAATASLDVPAELATLETDPAILREANRLALERGGTREEIVARTFQLIRELTAAKGNAVKTSTPDVADNTKPAAATGNKRSLAAELLAKLDTVLAAVSANAQTAATAVAQAEPHTGMSETQAVGFVKNEFSKLGIPGLSPIATRPEFRVEFELGGLGKMQARYHWVGIHNNNLYLVYDSRFEYGTLFEPPVLGAENPITINVYADNGVNSVRAASMDIVHPFGVFYMITLPIVEKLSQPPAMQPMRQPSQQQGISLFDIVDEDRVQNGI